MHRKRVIFNFTGISIAALLLFILLLTSDYHYFIFEKKGTLVDFMEVQSVEPKPWFDVMRTEQLGRIQHVREACANEDLFLNKAYTGRSQLIHYFSKQYNFSYCKIPKAGCSFWTQIFTILQRGSNNSKHVFGMTRRNIHTQLKGKLTVPFRSNAILQSRTVLVSRNPYSRLFSAFIDKMFLPLFYSGAANIVANQRGIPENELSCVSSITFQEFLKQLVENAHQGKTLNRHWAPMFALCKPCAVNVLAVVKQESFSEDVEYTLKEVGVAGDQYDAIYDALHDHRIEATIPGIVRTVMQRGKGKHCKLDIAKRLWISFQIQGYIRNDTDFPFDIINTEEKASNMTFIADVILETIRKNPLTSEESKAQRQRALVDAYARIDKPLIENIKIVYKQDFILFDYSFEPPL